MHEGHEFLTLPNFPRNLKKSCSFRALLHGLFRVLHHGRRHVLCTTYHSMHFSLRHHLCYLDTEIGRLRAKRVRFHVGKNYGPDLKSKDLFHLHVMHIRSEYWFRSKSMKSRVRQAFQLLRTFEANLLPRQGSKASSARLQASARLQTMFAAAPSSPPGSSSLHLLRLTR